MNRSGLEYRAPGQPVTTIGNVNHPVWRGRILSRAFTAGGLID